VSAVVAGVRNGIMDRPTVGRKLPRRTDAAEPQIRRSVVKYAFVGLSARAGATTLAFAFADRLARRERQGGAAASFRAKRSGGKTGAAGCPDASPGGGSGGGGANGVGGGVNGGGVTVVEIDDDELRAGGADYDRIGIDMRFTGRE
jgi:hypothetical protein